MNEKAGKNLLGELLIQTGRLTREQLGEALLAQTQGEGKLGFHLVKKGFISPQDLAEAMEEFLGFAQYDVTEMVRDPTVIDLVPPQIAQYYQVVPISHNHGTLTLAMREVPRKGVLKALEEVLGIKVEPLLCPGDSVIQALEYFYGITNEPGVIFHKDGERVFVLTDDDLKIQPILPFALKEDSPALSWLRTALVEAIKNRCREVHMIPEESDLQIAFKTSGRLHKVFRLTRKKKDEMERVLFQLFRLDPHARAFQRHGAIKLLVSGRKIHLTAHYSPTLHGHAFTLRFVDHKTTASTFETILEGLSGEEGMALEKLVREGRGVIFVTGNSDSKGMDVLPALLAHSVRIHGKSGPVLLASEGLGPSIEGVTQIPVDPHHDSIADTMFGALRHNPVVIAADRIRDRRGLEAVFLAAPRCLIIAGISPMDGFSALGWLSSHGFKSPVKAGLLGGILEVWSLRQNCPACQGRFTLPDNVLTSYGLPTPKKMLHSEGCKGCDFGENIDSEWVMGWLGHDEPFKQLAEGDMDMAEWINHRNGRRAPTLYHRVLERVESGEVDAAEITTFPSQEVNP